jgi:hypothetical protein
MNCVYNEVYCNREVKPTIWQHLEINLDKNLIRTLTDKVLINKILFDDLILIPIEEYILFEEST